MFGLVLLTSPLLSKRSVDNYLGKSVNREGVILSGEQYLFPLKVQFSNSC